jgi:hypothetical protein
MRWYYSYHGNLDTLASNVWAVWVNKSSNSLLTALELIPLVPHALALPSPAQLQQANQELQTQITERLRVEAELRKYQNHLE